jgi:predicted RNA-binding protein with TRAM domain
MFEKLYLYTAADDLGTPLDTETSLTGTGASASVTFSGFNLTIPKGASNGVVVVVRGDVKNDPTEFTMALHWDQDATTTDWTIKDDNNDALTASQYATGAFEADGQTTTIASGGTFTMAFDSEYTGLTSNKNVLAGTLALVGRLKLTASKENVKIEDLSLHNLDGSATADDVAYLRLYSDAAMTNQIGQANLNASRIAFFDNVNIEVPTTGIKYVYVGAVVKGIDYSSSPAADSTATVGTTIALDIASTTGYTVIAKGVSTGEVLPNTGVSSSTAAVTSTIMGAVISNVTSSFANGLLANGAGKDIFSFKVTAPASSNYAYDGTPLGIKVGTVTFSIATSTGVGLSGLKIERVGGANGEKDALDASAVAAVAGNGSFVINFNSTYATGTLADAIVRPGETAEYVVRGTVAGVEANDSLQVTIEGLATNFAYNHTTTAVGTNSSSVYPLLTGITYVRGGTLSN